MAEHPILFTGSMVRAILEGKKTQTRRVIRPQVIGAVPEGYYMDAYNHSDEWCFWTPDNRVANTLGPTSETCMWKCPYGAAGDRLWVREAAYIAPPNFGRDASDCNVVDNDGRPRVVGWAASMDSDGVRVATEFGVKLTPSIHMPRWASRITLGVCKVRVERAQDITEDDAAAEGIERRSGPYILDFARLWNTINAKRGYGWVTNPFVWVVEFRPFAPSDDGTLARTGRVP